MSQLTNFAEDLVIQFFFRTGTPTKPSVLAFALYTAAPGEAGGGTEATWTGYTRPTLNPLDANWAATAGGNGVTSNVSAIPYGAPTSGPQTMTHMAILDSATIGSGNMLLYGALTNSRVLNNGDAAPSYAAGAVVITVA